MTALRILPRQMPRSMLAVATVAFVIACATGPDSARSPAAPDTRPFLAAATTVHAFAGLADATGKSVGSVELTEERHGVRVDITVFGMKEGLHGVHVHAVGKCEGQGAFASAGAHFNPSAKVHGWLSTNGPHAGDLGNVRVGTDGRGTQVFFTAHLSLNPAASQSVVPPAGGLSIVVHAGPDDDKTDPTGNSGDRVACGVIARNAF